MTDVTWNTGTSTGYSVNTSTNVATKNSGSDSWTDNYIRSNEDFDVSSGTHTITFTRPTSAMSTMLGFNKDSLNHYFTNSNDFSIYLNDQKMTIYESGSLVHNESGTLDLTDTFKIEISSSSAKYYINNSLKYTSSSTPSGTYYVDAHAYQNGSPTPSDLESSQGGTSSSDVNGHAHLKPLHIFRRQRDWF